MLSLVALLPVFFLNGVNAQSCSVAVIGPCFGDMCPPDHTCLTNMAAPSCCATASVQPATTAKPSTNCVDLLNPSTGVSDCPPNAYLCNNGLYYNLMTQQCPKTCGRCAGTGAPTATCVDRVPNCPAQAGLCNDSTYYTLLTVQCPKTCNRCNEAGAGTGTGTGTGPAASCIDEIDPTTGISDCTANANLCNDSLYFKIMTQKCPRTCGRCATGK